MEKLIVTYRYKLDERSSLIQETDIFEVERLDDQSINEATYDHVRRKYGTVHSVKVLKHDFEEKKPDSWGDLSR